MLRTIRTTGILILLTTVVLTIFFVDVVTPSDNVSICFAYCVPIFFTILTRPRDAFALAALATLLSIVGSVVQPAYHDIVAFVGNRVIAVLAQWSVAALVLYRHRNEDLTQQALEDAITQQIAGRRFLDVLSHEIATPLTTIAGQAFRLSRLAALATPDEIAMRAGKIRTASSRIERMITQVQIKQDLEEQLVTPNLQPMDLVRLIEDTSQELLATDASAIITHDLDKMPARIEGDPILLSHALHNVLGNAIKYSKATRSVKVTGRREGPLVVIEVLDKGIGIPSQDCKHVFSPYFRARNTGGIRGIGIGLHLTKRLIDAHGGSIHVSSSEHEGTTVTVSLPIHASSGIQRAE